MTSTHFRKLERMYHESKVNKLMYPSIQLEVGEGKATISYQTDSNYFHALNALHGSVYFKLLDDVAFFAANSVVEEVFVLTSSFNIHFLRPVTSGQLIATGQLKFQSKNLWLAEATIVNEKGKEVGFGSGSFMKSQIALTADIGYY